MSTPQAFTLSSEALSRFPVAIQRTIVDVVQSELEKARSNCIQVLASPHPKEPIPTQGPQGPMDEAWQREATRFVHSIEGFLNSCPSVKRGPNFKADSKRILEDAFQRSQFLNKAECRIVAKAAGLSCQQVRTWFQNKRNRSTKKSSKAVGKLLSRGCCSSKSASTATCSPPTSVATTGSGSTSHSTTRSNPLGYQAGAVGTDLGAQSKVMLTLPYRVQEIGLTMDCGAPPFSFFESSPTAHYPPMSDTSQTGEAYLWFEEAVAPPGSPQLRVSTTDWNWSKIHQSLWPPYTARSAGPMCHPQSQGDNWLPIDGATLAMAGPSLIEFQEPVSETS